MPVASKTTLSVNNGGLLADGTEYRSMVGALQHLTMTRPDIAYSVHVVSQYMHAPCTTHLFAIKRIFRYLRGTLDHSLHLQPTSSFSVVVVYSDTNWARCRDTARSTTSYALFWDLILSHGAPRNSLQFPSLPLKLRIVPSHILCKKPSGSPSY